MAQRVLRISDSGIFMMSFEKTVTSASLPGSIEPLSAFRCRCRIGTMSSVTEIREAIRKLPAKEAWELAHELRDHLDALWDKQFEEDVQAGRLDDLIARAREEHARGKTRSMDEIIGDK
jgi:hypothetical protein